MAGVPLAVEAGDIDPHGLVEQETAQVTPLFEGSSETVTEKEAVAPAATLAEVGATAILIPGTITVACPEAVVLATEVAVRLTVKSPAGGSVGAL